MKESAKFYNTFRIYLRDAKTNELVQYEEGQNLVTTAGLQWVLDRMAGPTGEIYNAMSYLAVGDKVGPTAAALTDVALEQELARTPNTYSRAATTGTFSGFFNVAEANGTITEVGFFGGYTSETADSGTLFNRKVLSTPITKTVDYTLTIDLDVAVA